MSEESGVRLDVQHFSVENKRFKYIWTQSTGVKWSHISCEELLHCFELVFLQIFACLSIHEQSNKLLFLKASLFFTFTFKLIFDFSVEDLFDDVFERDQANFL